MPDVELLTPRPMHGNMRRWLTRKYCARREAVRLWGEVRGRVKHALLPYVWGDGRSLFAQYQHAWGIM
jgi:hypothetical protein